MMANNHRLAKKRQLAPSDLKGEEIIGLNVRVGPAAATRALCRALCKAAGFSPKISHEASGLPELMILVTKRMGVAILDSFARVAPVPGITFVGFKAPGLRLDIHAAYSAQAHPHLEAPRRAHARQEARRAAATF